MWQTIQLLLGPDEHTKFLIEAVRRWDIEDPDTGEILPKVLPRQCFPAHPDKHMVAWYEGVSERLNAEAEEEMRKVEDEREANRSRVALKSQETDDEESVDSRGPALEYFRNPLYRHADSKSTVAPHGSKPYDKQLPPPGSAHAERHARRRSSSRNRSRRLPSRNLPRRHYSRPRPPYDDRSSSPDHGSPHRSRRRSRPPSGSSPHYGDPGDYSLDQPRPKHHRRSRPTPGHRSGPNPRYDDPRDDVYSSGKGSLSPPPSPDERRARRNSRRKSRGGRDDFDEVDDPHSAPGGPDRRSESGRQKQVRSVNRGAKRDIQSKSRGTRGDLRGNDAFHNVLDRSDRKRVQLKDNSDLGIAVESSDDGSKPTLVSDDGTARVWGVESRESLHALESRQQGGQTLGGLPTEGDAIPHGYDSTLQRPVFPPSLDAVERLVKQGSVDSVHQILEQDFDRLARGSYSWLLDLVEDGFELIEIAELLISIEKDDPWIFYEPVIDHEIKPRANFHYQSCIHTFAEHGSLAATQIPVPKHSKAFNPDHCHDIKRSIEEMCGFAGIVPSSKSQDEWDGHVTFTQEGDSVRAVVSYSPNMSEVELSRSLILRLRHIAARLRYALGLLQHHQVCCNSFTAFGWNLNSSGHMSLELHRVDIMAVVSFLDVLESLEVQDATITLPQRHRQLPLLWEATNQVLLQSIPLYREAITAFPSDGDQEERSMMHQASLALQVVSLQILSYIHAHTGYIRTGILTLEVGKVVLLGAASTNVPSSQEFRVTVEPVDLTCLSGLTRDAVLVFRVHPGPVSSNGDCITPYDVVASPLDIVDTWGPALLVTDTRSPSNDGILGIEIGGGLLSRSEHARDVLHWQSLPNGPGAAAGLISADAFALRPKQRIGAVQINDSCTLRAVDRHEAILVACQENLHELGASPPRWVLQTFVTGLQAEQYALFNVGAEFEKSEGVTLKDRIFRRLASTNFHILYEDLEAFYGLEVSLCTGIARRVRLRLLLAAVLPAYVDAYHPGPPEWETLGKNLVEALKTTHFRSWLTQLPMGHERTVILTLGSLLTHLKNTGVTSEGTLDVAWICPRQVQKCFRLRCNNESGWARILADTEHCATFACVTTSCFEAGSTVCRKTRDIRWRNATELLDTEVYRLNVDNSSTATPTSIPFALEEGKKYWMGTGVTATANLGSSPILKISRRHLPLEVEKALQRARRIRRDHIRERGSCIGQVIPVLIGAQSR
jgi:hypothetical protein